MSLHDLHVDGGDLAERIERDVPGEEPRHTAIDVRGRRKEVSKKREEEGRRRNEAREKERSLEVHNNASG